MPKPAKNNSAFKPNLLNMKNIINDKAIICPVLPVTRYIILKNVNPANANQTHFIFDLLDSDLTSIRYIAKDKRMLWAMLFLNAVNPWPGLAIS